MQENTTKMTPKKSDTLVDPIELMRQLLAHIWIILFVAVVCMALLGAYTQYYVTPIYESTAKLYVLNSGDSAINLSDLQLGSYLASDYIEVFRTWEVHQMVIENLGLEYSNKYMQDMVTITNPSNTRILYITFKSPDPHEAMMVANEYANVAIQFIPKTMSTEQPNILSAAVEAANPTTPKMSLNLMLGFVLGLLISGGLVTLRFLIDDKIQTADDIRKYADLPVLAVVPALKRKHKRAKRGKREN